ncbi:APC family permease [Curtobacterium sp. VKM Ac-1376]|uniref:APC family permease n=1 Tax=Curtobacterium sp. VKM Ac-1376 TaxID=123312 RepID=UPI00188D4DE2|nr:APC family permease [Curtobacterium sp. VKM Ac-1376]MBF4616027.1 APC family permease [Curtobacterium sp. VKM Ac-1376]
MASRIPTVAPPTSSGQSATRSTITGHHPDPGSGPGRGGDAPQQLAHDSIGFIRNVSQPIAVAGPTAGTAIMASVMAGVTGTPGPLSFLLGIAAGALLVHVFTSLARHFESAGGTYLLAGLLVGTRTAVVVGFLYAASLFGASGGITVNVATFSQTLVQEITGAELPWPFFAVVLGGVALVLAVNHVRRFTAVITVVEVIGFIALITLGVTVLVREGLNGADVWAAFSVQGITPAQVFLGVVVAFSSFGGFEAGLLLSEETKDNKTTVPRGMWTALLLAGTCYVFACWFQYVGFGSVDALASSPEPMFSLARDSFGAPVADVMVCLVILAGTAAVSACMGGGGRVLYAMVRDGLAPRSWAVLSRVAQAPYRLVVGGAVAGALAWSTCALLGLSGPDAFNDILTTGGLFQMLIYTVISGAAVVWSTRRREFMTVAVAALAFLISTYTLVTTVFPTGGGGLGILPLVAAVYLLLVLAFVLAAGGRVRRIAQSPYWRAAHAERAALMARPGGSGRVDDVA